MLVPTKEGGVMEVRFSASLGDKVRLIDIDAVGRIDAVLYDGKQQYKIIYWLDGERHAEWVYAWEFKVIG